MSGTPKFIGIDPTGHWHWEPDGEQDGMDEYQRTSHAYARRFSSGCIWLGPICGDCMPPLGTPLWEEYTYCEDEGVYDDCPDCGRGPQPYRRIAEEAA